MGRYSQLVIQIYSRLLRFYPAQFHAEYADEMQDVFAQAVTDQENGLSLMGLMAGELWDLPFNLLREHIHERRAKALMILIEENVMSEAVVPMRVFRGLTWTLLTTFILYSVLILLPYFYHGLNRLSLDVLTSGSYDPKGYTPYVYDGIVGTGIYLLGVLMVILGPTATAAMGGVLALTLRRHWRQFQQKQRILGSAAVVVAAFMLGIALSPIASALTAWLLD